MRLGRRVRYDHTEGKIVVQTTWDPTPTLNSVDELRHRGIDGFGENKLVGRIPMDLMHEWIKEAGLKWDDREAVQDMMRRKLLSGEFDKLRPWKGTF